MVTYTLRQARPRPQMLELAIIISSPDGFLRPAHSQDVSQARRSRKTCEVRNKTQRLKLTTPLPHLYSHVCKVQLEEQLASGEPFKTIRKLALRAKSEESQERAVT